MGVRLTSVGVLPHPSLTSRDVLGRASTQPPRTVGGGPAAAGAGRVGRVGDAHLWWILAVLAVITLA